MRTLSNIRRIRQAQALLITGIWVLSTLFINIPVIKAIFSIIFLALMPGYFLYRVLVGYIPSQKLIKVYAYSLGLSLISLMILGLGLNQIVPLFGDKHPLSTGLLTVAIGAFTGLLIVLSMILRPLEAKFDRPSNKKDARAKFKMVKTFIPAIILPILAIGGATTLNNGGSGWLAMLVIGLIAAYYLFLIWRKPGHQLRFPIALYGTSLALLFGISMRGWNITGHDIMQEYQVFQLTLQHMSWNINYYKDAYNACLSITILPTIFQKLTGIEPQYIYKLVFQLFFAGIAPIMYLTVRDYLTKKAALLSVLIFVIFPTFLVDMSMLNRQEIAFICFALSLMAGLDRKLKHKTKVTLISIYLIGMILSHYSTSYVTIGGLAVTLVLGVIYAYRKKLWFRRKVSSNRASKIKFWIYGPTITIISFVVIFGWGTLATHTSGNLTQNLSSGIHSLSSFFKPGQPSITSSVPNPNENVITRYIQYENSNLAFSKNNYYSDASIYAVKQQSQRLSNETEVGTILHLSKQSINKFFDGFPKVYALYIFAGSALGIFLALTNRARSRLPIQYFLIGVAFLIIIGITHYAPNASIDYSVVREIQQTLIICGVPIVLGSIWFLRKLRVPTKVAPKILGSVMVGFFLAMSGFLPSITGGYKPALALSNSGFYYEAYYTHQDEITATSWLVNTTPVGSRVYSDEFARRMMIAYSDSKIFSQPTLLPSAIPIDSYVFLSDTNTVFNTVPVYPDSGVAYYNVPHSFLNSNKNLVYSAGNVEVYYSTYVY